MKDLWSRPAILLLATSWLDNLADNCGSDKFPYRKEFAAYTNMLLVDLGLPHNKGKKLTRQINEVLQGKFALHL